MKSTKLLWAIIICLALGLGVSVLYNMGIINISDGLKQVVAPNKTLKVFHLTNMKMTLDREWSLPKGSAIMKLDFIIENISKEPQTLYQNDLSLFDYNDCRYDVSTNFTSRLNPLLFSETINPKTKKELSLIFEVPQGELYSVGYSDHIDRIGKQIFVDKIRKIRCEYVTFKEMVEVRNRVANQSPVQIESPKTEEVSLKVEFEKSSESPFESLIKKMTNPANEIEVDLNDFLGTPDNGTDWNYTELSETDCKALARQKIYYSENKGAWVKEKPSTDNSTSEAEKRREAMERELKGVK